MSAFLSHDDPRLRMVARPVAAITPEILAIFARMIALMDAMPGYGLAAPQIGIPLRLAVVDCSATRGQALRLANPEIIATSERMMSFEEASPHLPGLSAKVTRPAEVTVRYLDPDGLQREQVLTDLWAISLQHQIDHLNGKLYIDHLSALKRAILLKKARKGRMT